MVNIDNITFVITIYRSEKTIYKCLDSIPKNVKKIILENSKNKNLKFDLERKYENLKCFLMPENFGYGKANNYGVKKSLTNYVFILNPDAVFYKNSFNKMLKILANKDFSIAAPLDNLDYKNYQLNRKNTIEVDSVKGFAMLLNKSKMFNQYFDENFFLYLEEIDLCKRIKRKKRKIILINSKIKHLGGLSHGNREDIEMEKSRNWHWMWSNFYYLKKHNSYFLALLKTFPKFVSSLLKYSIYKLLNKSIKCEIYRLRMHGLISSYCLKKSFYRPYTKSNLRNN